MYSKHDLAARAVIENAVNKFLVASSSYTSAVRRPEMAQYIDTMLTNAGLVIVRADELYEEE